MASTSDSVKPKLSFYFRRSSNGADPGIVKVAEYALLGNFQYADHHGLFQMGVVLEGLHHEAADEGDHLVVVLIHMGRMQGCVILVEKDVWGFAVGAVEPGGKPLEWISHSPRSVPFLVDYACENNFLSRLRLRILVTVQISMPVGIQCAMHFLGQGPCIVLNVCVVFHILETQMNNRILPHELGTARVGGDGKIFKKVGVGSCE